MRQRRKRSAAITLVLAGTLSGCSDSVPQQDVYSTAFDCRRDWADHCRPVTDGRYPPWYLYGPVHCTDDVVRPSANEVDAVERGGFGCTANRFSSGS